MFQCNFVQMKETFGDSLKVSRYLNNVANLLKIIIKETAIATYSCVEMQFYEIERNILRVAIAFSLSNIG